MQKMLIRYSKMLIGAVPSPLYGYVFYNKADLICSKLYEQTLSQANYVDVPRQIRVNKIIKLA